MARYLLIVARDQPELYKYLVQKFAGEKEIHVLVDRRWGLQRGYQPERRRPERRSVSKLIVVRQDVPG